MTRYCWSSRQRILYQHSMNMASQYIITKHNPLHQFRLSSTIDSRISDRRRFTTGSIMRLRNPHRDSVHILNMPPQRPSITMPSQPNQSVLLRWGPCSICRWKPSKLYMQILLICMFNEHFTYGNLAKVMIGFSYFWGSLVDGKHFFLTKPF